MLDLFKLQAKVRKLSDDSSRTASNKFADVMHKAEFLTREREVELIKLAQAGDIEARDLIVLSHMRIGLKVAGTYARTVKTGIVSTDDIIQEVAIGLCHALEKFDLSEDVRFATYAIWWIRSFAQQVVHLNNHHLRLGTSKGVRRLAYSYHNDKMELSGLGLSDEEQNRILAKRYGVSYEVIRCMGPVVSAKIIELDKGQLFEGESIRGQEIADSSPLQDILAEEAIDGERGNSELHKALKVLSARERDIIKRRFLGEKEQTLEVIAQTWGISKERVRQIQHVALGKLRAVLEKEV